jgi:hypothetical protein
MKAGAKETGKPGAALESDNEWAGAAQGRRSLTTEFE